jgi:hypothetical protein
VTTKAQARMQEWLYFTANSVKGFNLLVFLLSTDNRQIYDGIYQPILWRL